MPYEDFKTKYDLSLNPQQEDAVQAVEGPVLLLAVPGSGKTTVLINRLGYMITEKRINPRNILTITYTVASTKDMKARFISKYGEDLSYGLDFLTINSLSQRIINHYGEENGKTPFKVIENTDRNRLIKDIFYQVNEDYATESDINEINTAITYVKNMRLKGEEINNHKVKVDNFPSIYERYQKSLKDRGLMDFDDQMVYALTILSRFPEHLEYFQNRYKYICVDEAQDTSKLQHDLINLLASKYKNLFMVGDEDQSIYGYRAAYPMALMDFDKVYPGAKVLLMETNYRSNKEIVEVSDIFIQKNKDRHKKTMTASRSTGGIVKEIPLKARKAQANYLLKVATNLAEETAILYRNNESCLLLVDLLDKNDIPYRIRKTDLTFFSNPVVTDIVSFLRYALNPSDSEAFLRIYYKTNARIKKDLAYRAVDIATSNFFKEISLMDGITAVLKEKCRDVINELKQIPKLTPSKAISVIRYSLGYDKYLKDKEYDFEKANTLQMLSAGYDDIEAFLDRLGELEGILEQGSTDDSANLILSTIHSSKGLEYDTVYLVDLIDGVFPSCDMKVDEKGYEEERRLFYVGMTRAKNKLYIFSYENDSSAFTSEVFLKFYGKSPKNPIDSVSYGTGYNRYANSKQGIYIGDLDRLPTKKSAFDYKKLVGTTSSSKKNGFTQADKAKYKAGTRIYHKTYHEGVIIKIDGDTIFARFDETEDEKKMSLQICLSNGLITLL